jgi:hypothetical protein
LNPQKIYTYIKSKRSNTSRIPTLKENDNLLSTPKQKAAALNRQYQSVFTEEPSGDIPTKEDGLIPRQSPGSSGALRNYRHLSERQF